MMRTSAYQFEIMVTFMEEHGDLGNPQNMSKNRIANLTKWEELTTMLNCDVNGDSKTCVKWKKVWADLKNNTKKKQKRIQAANEGGLPVHTALSELEQRVLSMIGVPFETTSAVDETGSESESSSSEEESIDRKPIHRRDPLKHPKRPRPDQPFPVQVRELPQNLPITDEDWRKFKVQQHRDYIELKREQNRIREMEVRAQMGWQDIGNRALNMLNKLVDRYCRE